MLSLTRLVFIPKSLPCTDAPLPAVGTHISAPGLSLCVRNHLCRQARHIRSADKVPGLAAVLNKRLRAVGTSIPQLSHPWQGSTQARTRHHFPELPGGTELELSTDNPHFTISLSPPPWGFLESPPPNHRHSNLCLRVCFCGSPNKDQESLFFKLCLYAVNSQACDSLSFSFLKHVVVETTIALVILKRNRLSQQGERRESPLRVSLLSQTHVFSIVKHERCLRKSLLWERACVWMGSHREALHSVLWKWVECLPEGIRGLWRARHHLQLSSYLCCLFPLGPLSSVLPRVSAFLDLLLVTVY